MTSRIVSLPFSTMARRSIRVASLGDGVARLAVGGLHAEALGLIDGVVDLRERIAELHSADEVLEPLDDRRVLVGRAGERRELDGVVVQDRRLDQLRLDEDGQRMVDELRPGLVLAGVHVARLEPCPEVGLVA